VSSLSAALAFSLGGDDSEVGEAVVTIDHVRTGLSRLCLQFRSANPMDAPEERTNMEKLLACLLAPFDELEVAFQQLIQLRDIYTAAGVYLDSIGNLVQQARNGLGDDDYRRFLFARIRTNRSDGRRETLITIARLILNDTAARVVVNNQGPAAVVVRIESSLIPDALAAILIGFLTEAVGAGIGMMLESSPDTLADQFALPLAAFATAGAYTAGQTTITVDDASAFPAIGTLIIDEGTAAEESVDYAGTTATTFALSSALLHNHPIRTAVTLDEPSTGKGCGDVTEAGENLTAYSDVGLIGGTLIDARIT
jgi:Protein of unknown function (DUF2612)